MHAPPLTFMACVRACVRRNTGLPEISATLVATGVMDACRKQPSLTSAVVAALDGCVRQSEGDLRVLRYVCACKRFGSSKIDFALKENAFSVLGSTVC